MITINQPYVYNAKDKSRVESVIYDSYADYEFKIWYEVDSKYEEYLCTELSDAFLLALLPRAAYTEQDIYICGNTSPKLLFNTLGVHIPFLSCLYKKAKIHVTSNQSVTIHFAGAAVATGCSLGIDSLSTIYQHMDSNCPQEYRLTHLTLFNSCQLGDKDHNSLEKSLAEATEKALYFTNEIGLPLLVINTNVNETIFDLPLTPTQVTGYFTISCPMALQKFFKKYLLASSLNAEYITIDYSDIEHTESVYVPLLGNENLEVSVSEPFVKRTEKTRKVSEYPLTKKYLDVCWAAQIANERNGGNWYIEGKKYRNCGWCDKCRRTLLTLELLGKISDYEESFDLEKYNQYRNRFIIKVVAGAKKDILYREIYELMLEKGMHIPFMGKVLQRIAISNSEVFVKMYGIYKRMRD